jgi:hypothetical protein
LPAEEESGGGSIPESESFDAGGKVVEGLEGGVRAEEKETGVQANDGGGGVR